MPNEALTKLIDARLLELGSSDRAASIAATGKPDLIRTIRRGSTPSAANLRALEEALKMPEGALIRVVGPQARKDERNGTPAPDGLREAQTPFQPQRNAGQPQLDVTLGKPDLDVYGSAQGGPYGMIVDPHPVERIARPRLLTGVHNAFGVYVVGDSMAPVFDQGDMAYVHPARPPRRGDDALIYRVNDGHWEAMIKRLEGWNEKSWKLRQFNPAKSFTLSRQEWPHIFVVTGRERGG